MYPRVPLSYASASPTLSSALSEDCSPQDSSCSGSPPEVYCEGTRAGPDSHVSHQGRCKLRCLSMGTLPKHYSSMRMLRSLLSLSLSLSLMPSVWRQTRKWMDGGMAIWRSRGPKMMRTCRNADSDPVNCLHAHHFIHLGTDAL